MDQSGSVMGRYNSESFDKGSGLEFHDFLSFANGSIDELKSRLYRVVDRGCINNDKFDELYLFAEELIKVIGSLINSLNKSSIKGTKFKGRTGN